MTVAYNQGDNGITVSEVAERLHVSGPFITTETSALVSRELLLKIPNPRDRRSVLLRLAARGQRKLKELAPHLADVNDAVFTPLGVEEFQMLSTITTELVATSARAIALLSASPPTLLDREDH
jgi:DNA-binding MarR family transcriptional regulator